MAIGEHETITGNLSEVRGDGEVTGGGERTHLGLLGLKRMCLDQSA